MWDFCHEFKLSCFEMTPRRPRYRRGRIQWLFTHGSMDTSIGSVWKAWHFVVIYENISLTLQLRRILSKSSMWKCLFRLFKYFQEVSWPIQLCLLAVDAATMCMLSWRRQYHWQAGGPFHYSLIVGNQIRWKILIMILLTTEIYGAITIILCICRKVE